MSVAVALDFQFRSYDPHSGRFVQEDPEPGVLSIPSSLNNKYSYAANNPANLIDPTGRSFLGKVAAIAIGSLFGPIGILVAINVSGDFSDGEKKFANTVAIITVAAIAGVATGGAAFAAAGGGLAGAAAGAFAGAVVGGLAGGFVGGATNSLQGKGFFDGFTYGFNIGVVVGAVTGGLYGYFGSAGSAYAAGENWALSIWNDPIGYALANPESTIVPAVGLLGAVFCKKKNTENDFSDTFSCSL